MSSVLFICNGNSCRSIMAEALLNHLSKGKYRAFSAGNSPAGYVHPKALETLNRNGIPFTNPHSKSWNDFSTRPFNLVVAICEEIVDEVWPVFAGKPRKLYWNIPDPAKAEGGDEEINAIFDQIFKQIKENIENLIVRNGE